MSEAEAPQWPGFWARILAFCIDFIVLGLPLMLLGWAAFDTFAALGGGGRLVGLVAGAAYFGILESRIGGGRSVGKRLFKLQVLGTNGETLPVGRAVARALVKVAPVVANGASVSSSALLFGLIALIALFGVGLAQIFLYLANKPSRRCLHDLVADAGVARFGAKPTMDPFRPIHLRIAFALIGVVSLLAVGLITFAELSPPRILQQAQRAAVALEGLPEVASAQVGNTTASWTTSHGTTRTRYATVAVRLNRRPGRPEAEARRLALTVIAASKFEPSQKLSVALVHGFDFGFATGFNRYMAVKSVAEWQQPPFPQ